MPADLTAEFARFVVRTGREGVPDGSRAVVRTGFTDAIAVLLAGLDEPVASVVRRHASAQGGTAEARVALGDERLPAPLAAMVNATIAHALDWDDYAFSVHPSAVLVPVCLAVGEAVGANGEQMTRAYVAGYELWGEFMAREPDRLHDRGWHPTGLFGPIAAAAATAVLMKLDEETTRHAIAIACSHAGGVMANFGTSTKPYHGGKAAEAGIVAARLAAAGLDAGAHAVEDRLGLMAVLSPKDRVDRERAFDVPNRPWHILKHKLNVKKYATVGASQRLIDSVLAWRRGNEIDVRTVAKLEPLLSRKFYAVMPFDTPKSALEAKFSLPYVVAAPLLAGKLTLAELTDGFVTSPELVALMAKVTPVLSDDFDPDYMSAAPADYVDITFTDGRRERTPPIKRATGHADVPLPTAELAAKFHDCAAKARIPRAKADALFAVLQRIDTVASTREIAL